MNESECVGDILGPRATLSVKYRSGVTFEELERDCLALINLNVLDSAATEYLDDVVHSWKEAMRSTTIHVCCDSLIPDPKP